MSLLKEMCVVGRDKWVVTWCAQGELGDVWMRLHKGAILSRRLSSGGSQWHLPLPLWEASGEWSLTVEIHSRAAEAASVGTSGNSSLPEAVSWRQESEIFPPLRCSLSPRTLTNSSEVQRGNLISRHAHIGFGFYCYSTERVGKLALPFIVIAPPFASMGNISDCFIHGGLGLICISTSLSTTYERTN